MITFIIIMMHCKKLTGEWEIKIKLELRIGLTITRDEIQNNHTEWLADIEHAVSN